MRLKWKRTSVRDPDDYVGKDPERPHAYCRIYKTVANSSGQPWFWTASDGHVDLGTGYTASVKDAAELAEAAYWPKREKI